MQTAEQTRKPTQKWAWAVCPADEVENPQVIPEVVLSPTLHRPLRTPRLLSGREARTSRSFRNGLLESNLDWGGGKGESAGKSSGLGREPLTARPLETASPSWDLEIKAPRNVPLEASAFGNLRGTFGSFRQFQPGPSTLPARSSLLPTPLRSFWPWAAVHVGVSSGLSRPYSHLVCSRPHSSNPYSSSFSPIPGDARAP